MKLKIEETLLERIYGESRSFALLTLPGMGLSTILRSMCEEKNGLFLYLRPETLVDLWEKEYSGRPKNRRFVLHGAIISTIRDRFSLNDLTDAEIFKTNLTAFFKAKNFLSEYEHIYIVIDDFQCLPPDLAVIILDETKSLDDQRDDTAYQSIRAVKFLIGGAFNIHVLYKEIANKDVSPATNFSKIRPHEFLLDDSEIMNMIEENYKSLTPDESKLIIEWTRGYLHYVLSFCNWMEAQKTYFGRDCSLQKLLIKLKEALEDNELNGIFSYCYKGWKKYKEDEEALLLLGKAASAGYISSTSRKAKELACAGLIMPQKGQSDIFYFPNHLVELFIRQKLADKRKSLSIGDSASWVIQDQNIKAYAYLLEIENRLRNFIGDIMFRNCGCESVDDVINQIKDSLNQADPEHKKGTNWKSGITSRKTSEELSPFSSGDTFDSILTFLDFADLGEIVTVTEKHFNAKLVSMLPTFLDELNFIRRRIAHNRPITETQLGDMVSRWKKIQRMMSI